jgi:hypothetical protein
MTGTTINYGKDRDQKMEGAVKKATASGNDMIIGYEELVQTGRSKFQGSLAMSQLGLFLRVRYAAFRG